MLKKRLAEEKIEQAIGLRRVSLMRRRVVHSNVSGCGAEKVFS